MATAQTLTILRVHTYSSRHGSEVYNYRDAQVPSTLQSSTCIVEYKGQKSGGKDKHIAPGAYVVIHTKPSAPLELLGRVEDVQMVSARTKEQPAVYRLVVRRVIQNFKGFKPALFRASLEWHKRQRHLANMFVQWFDVDPSAVYLLAGLYQGIVNKVFVDGFKHPPLVHDSEDSEDSDDEDVTMIFRRKRNVMETVFCDEDDEDITLVFKRKRV